MNEIKGRKITNIAIHGKHDLMLCNFPLLFGLLGFFGSSSSSLALCILGIQSARAKARVLKDFGQSANQRTKFNTNRKRCRRRSVERRSILGVFDCFLQLTACFFESSIDAR